MVLMLSLTSSGCLMVGKVVSVVGLVDVYDECAKEGTIRDSLTRLYFASVPLHGIFALSVFTIAPMRSPQIDTMTYDDQDVHVNAPATHSHDSGRWGADQAGNSDVPVLFCNDVRVERGEAV